MKQAGFVDVQITLRETPLGASYGEIGTKWVEIIMGGFRRIKSPVLQFGGLGLVRDEKDYDDLMHQMELE